MQKPFVYLDTDISLGTPGAEIDDGAALLVLLRSRQIEIAGIGSVFGNTPIKDVNQNLARILSCLGRQGIPLGIGASGPLAGNLDWFDEWQAGYGATLPFDFPQPNKTAAQLLIHLIQVNPGKITILAIGPLTNLAAALQMAPGIEKQVKDVVAMGGSFSSQPQEPEFNIHCDPAAAQMVFQADWPLTLLGLEITRQISFSRDDFAALPSAHPAVRLLREQAAGWIDRVEAMGWEKDGCSLHDAAAAAYLIQPDLFSSMPAGIEILTNGQGPKGGTIIQPARAADERIINIVTEVDGPKCKELIWSSLRQLS